MAHALKHSAQEHWYDLPSRVVNRGFSWVRDHLFRPLMAGVIWTRYPVFAGVILILGATRCRSSFAATCSGGSSMRRNAARSRAISRWHRRGDQGRYTGHDAHVAGSGRGRWARNMRPSMAQSAGLCHCRNWRHHRARACRGRTPRMRRCWARIAIELIDADLRPYSVFAFVAELAGCGAAPSAAGNHQFSRLAVRTRRRCAGRRAVWSSAETLKAAAEDSENHCIAVSRGVGGRGQSGL